MPACPQRVQTYMRLTSLLPDSASANEHDVEISYNLLIASAKESAIVLIEYCIHKLVRSMLVT